VLACIDGFRTGNCFVVINSPDLRNENLLVVIIGKEQPVDILAKMAGTIGYELFTRLGKRIEKNYVTDSK